MTRTSVGRHLVRTQAQLMLQAVEATGPLSLDALSRDAVQTLGAWPEVQLRSVPEANTEPSCSVAGAYIPTAQPPILAVAAATSPGRRAFTALHELGHHLQQTRMELAGALFEHPTDVGQVLEDLACDDFAASVLIPDPIVDRVIPAAGPTARDVAALHRQTAASRAAVCVRAAQHLPAPGHVVLLDHDGQVQFASAHGLPPLGRGSDQSGVAVVERALAGAGVGRGVAGFYYRDGIEGQELYVNIAPMDGFLVAVAVTDHAPWEQFSAPSRDTGPSARPYTCENPGCSEEYTSFEAACPSCRIPKCPECRRCSCASATSERRCPTCFMMHPPAFFDGDRCLDCS